MKISLQTKFLVLCSFLVLLTTVGISVIMRSQDVINTENHSSESKLHLTSFYFVIRKNTSTERLREFLEQDTKLRITTSSYLKDTGRIGLSSFLVNYLIPVADEIKRFGHDVSIDRLTMYAEVAQRTETEIDHIDQSLRDVSHNAGLSQQLAKETMNAALSGQNSVDASIQGMIELQAVVATCLRLHSLPDQFLKRKFFHPVT